VSGLVSFDWQMLQRYCHHLIRLSVRETLLNDEIMENILPTLPGLCSLDLSNCSWLTDRSIRVVCAYLSQLQYLHLNNCVRMTGHVVKMVADQFATQLRTFELAWLNLFSTDLRHLTRMTSLTRLDLSGSRHSINVLPDILHSCHNLRELLLAHCTVDDDLIQTLVTSLTDLRELNINQSDAPPLSTKTLTVCPSIKTSTQKCTRSSNRFRISYTFIQLTTTSGINESVFIPSMYWSQWSIEC
jgi:hypothetical protein